ncbi:asparagine synthase (glutamine-hydrolyzing) [Brevibacillus humidisoli]|uniref:asparagine synthase (glutamine-hydrolyzing) n=1 Tax=Brevibacillus humidisoli TaxID=2895522 RepID=UPI001E2C761B|nr:asparagine synthase (glutamine-hydrolyzing) [Brevibacillus humidisoli]UFJ41457.1 asparagine synthase (glutamine-hydrolyzing) [Brevibacillus humidisoli]
MCGIVAMLSRQTQIRSTVLDRATRQLAHRGPDCQRTWLSETGKVGLGHARLSIIDLQTGDQPIASEDERLRIVVNGEFYDYERIQRELEKRGHRLRTRSDSEIALHLYEENGIGFMEHLRGEFALVLWDEQEQRLVAARDRFGIKPLFYTVQDDVLYIASEMKALFAAGVIAKWDEQSYYQHLLFYKHLDRSLFKDIHQVPPGHLLLATQHGIELKRYWDHDYPLLAETEERSEAEYIEEVRAALHESIRLRMRADVPVGFHLSGGVDSSAVLGMAAQHRTDPLQAFTVTFAEKAYDESEVARETASFVGADFHPIPLDYADFADHVVKAVWHAETIGINMNGVARYLKSKVLHERGIRVVLSGDGADELFAGYIFSRLDILLAGLEGLSEAEKLARLEEFLVHNPSFNHLPVASYLDQSLTSFQQRLGYTPTWILASHTSRSPLRQLLAPDYLDRLGDYDPHREFVERLDIEGQLAGRDRVKQVLYTWNKSILPNQILFADRLDMSHGVEVRMPMLDHKLFEVVRKLPSWMLINNYKEKYALREAAKPYLTKTVYDRPKQPFNAPPSTLQTDNKLFALAQDMLRSSVMDDVPFYDKKQIVGLLDQLPKMDQRQRVNTDAVLLLVLTTCLLQDLYVNASRSQSVTG